MWEGNELPQDRREVATRYPKVSKLSGTFRRDWTDPFPLSPHQSTVEPPHCYPSGIDGEGGGKVCSYLSIRGGLPTDRR